jgi:type VI secretion system protein VasI
VRTFLLLIAIFVVDVLSSAGAVSAQKCAEIENDTLRLECFDLEFRKTRQVSREAKWILVEEKSRIDDSTNIFMYVKSLEPIPQRFGGRDAARLIINCRENTTSLYINFGKNFMSDHAGGGRVITRIDEKPAKTIPMQVSTNNEALGLWRGGTSIPFIQSMFGSEQMFVRATPFSESALSMDFPIFGLEEAIRPLRAACNW